MNTDRKRILIVDDSPIDISFVVNSLQKNYAIQVATDGAKAIQIAKSSAKPDIILMDVQMPGMDGFEACAAIKENSETEDIDVIFLSAVTTLPEKIKGYDVGGIDFITKPVASDELLQKISIAINNRSKREALLVEKNSMFSTAMAAITSEGEVGVVLNFTRELFSINSSTELANKITTTLESLDLQSSVVLFEQDGNHIFSSSSGPVSVLEKSLLLQLDAADRIFEKGRRLMFNFRGANLLIKNAPEDEEKRGRYRDILAMIMDSVVACHERIQFDYKLNILTADAESAFKSLGSSRTAHIKEGEKILQDLLVKLERSFLSWGLIDEQEQMLTNIVHEAIDAFELHTYKGSDIDNDMRQLIDRLLSIR